MLVNQYTVNRDGTLLVHDSLCDPCVYLYTGDGSAQV